MHASPGGCVTSTAMAGVYSYPYPYLVALDYDRLVYAGGY